MKTSIITITLLLATAHTIQASNITEDHLALIHNEILSLVLENEDQRDMIKSIKYNDVEDCLAMEFENKLELIHLFNDQGEVELMFPVGSNKVNLGLSLFKSGEYKMGFSIEGQSGIQFADIFIK